MKNTFSLFILASIFVLSSITNASAQTKKPISSVIDWQKSSTGTWIGMNRYTYKFDKANTIVFSSEDGTNFTEVQENVWQDKNGKWLKIYNGKLMSSNDGSKTWSEVPEWKFEGGDGKWYKFDSTWTLWIKKLK